MVQLLSHGVDDPKGYSLKQGLLLRKGKLVVVPTTPFHGKNLQHLHSSPEASHIGYHKTLYKVKLDFYWPCMRKDIKMVVNECQIYQMNKSKIVFH